MSGGQLCSRWFDVVEVVMVRADRPTVLPGAARTLHPADLDLAHAHTAIAVTAEGGVRVQRRRVVVGER